MPTFTPTTGTYKEPTRENYTFKGWSTKQNATKAEYTSDILPTDRATLYAVWERNEIDITFDANEGLIYNIGTQTTTGKATVGKRYGSSKTDFPSAVREGYVFLGWYTDKTWSKQITKNTIVEDIVGPITLYARWGAPYRVEHWKQNLDGGTEKNEENYTLEERYIETLGAVANSNVTPKVKTFTGFTSPTPQTVTVNENGTTVVKYYYERNSYVLTLDKNEYVASVEGAGTYKYGEEVTIKATLVQDTAVYTYAISKWNTSDMPIGSKNKEITLRMPAKNVSIIAEAMPVAKEFEVRPSTD